MEGQQAVIRHEKLVRDRIPEIIEASGKRCSCSILGQEEYLRQLRRKLDEELAEYQQSHSPEELADLLEVMMAVAVAQGSSWEEIEAIRRDKACKRGGFDGRVFLHEVYEG